MDDEVQRKGIKQELTTRVILPSKCFLSSSGHDLTPITTSILSHSQKCGMKNELRELIQDLVKISGKQLSKQQYAINKLSILHLFFMFSEMVIWELGKKDCTFLHMAVFHCFLRVM